MVYPAADAKPYGFPPSKQYVFRSPGAFAAVSESGFAPMQSYARGGLAEAWTGGSYELMDEELAQFPGSIGDWRNAYKEIATRVGISAAQDDLQRFSPLTASYQPALKADAHSQLLLDRYAQRRAALAQLGGVLGRSRVAVLSRPLGTRHACTHTGRCLQGCPTGALYAPSLTLLDLCNNPRLTYRTRVFVRRLVIGATGEVRGVVATDLTSNDEVEIACKRVVLAAGALATSRIVLETRAAAGEREPALDGLMDNRHVMIPFVTWSRIGAKPDLAHYQFHQLALGLEGANWREHIHGQVSALKNAAVHPVVQALPFDLRASLALFRRIRGALGVANIWLSDSRDAANRLVLRRGPEGQPVFAAEYRSDSRDAARTDEAIARVRRFLAALGCVAPRGMIKVLSRGSSVHYGGTIPFSAGSGEWTCSPDGELRAYRGVHIADAAAFPWLPAKNHTFTLMANAVRIAEMVG